MFLSSVRENVVCSRQFTEVHEKKDTIILIHHPEHQGRLLATSSRDDGFTRIRIFCSFSNKMELNGNGISRLLKSCGYVVRTPRTLHASQLSTLSLCWIHHTATGQQLLQLLPRQPQPAFRRGCRCLRRIGHFRKRQTRVVMHHKRHPL